MLVRFNANPPTEYGLTDDHGRLWYISDRSRLFDVVAVDERKNEFRISGSGKRSNIISREQLDRLLHDEIIEVISG